MDRDFIIINHPCIINNIENCFKTLGGFEKIALSVSKAQPEKLALRLRAEDNFHNPILSTPQVCCQYLLQIKRLKKTNQLTDLKEYKYTFKIIGKIQLMYEFTNLCDFQFLPIQKNENNMPKLIMNNVIPKEFLNDDSLNEYFTNLSNNSSQTNFLESNFELFKPIFFVPSNFSYVKEPIQKLFIENIDDVYETKANLNQCPIPNKLNQNNMNHKDCMNSLPWCSITFDDSIPILGTEYLSIKPYLKTDILKKLDEVY
ncbi:unnamed protein product [Gordionus sp. m RMFG-2023]